MPARATENRKASASSTVTGAISRRRSRRETPAADRRGQIIVVSARLFAEYGFETTSVRQIADEVNLLAGSLYHHFATKEDILHEVLRLPLERLKHDNNTVVELDGDAEHKLVAGMILRFHRYIRDGQMHAIVVNDSKFFRRREDFAYVQESKRQSFELQEQILKDGMAAGLFHPGIDTYLMIGTFARIVSTASAWFLSGDMYSSDRPDDYTFDRLVDFHLECVLRMIRSPSRLLEPIPRKACEALLSLDRADEP